MLAPAIIARYGTQNEDVNSINQEQGVIEVMVASNEEEEIGEDMQTRNRWQ
jgi:hypothetical protein